MLNLYFKPCLTKETNSYEMHFSDEIDSYISDFPVFLETKATFRLKMPVA